MKKKRLKLKKQVYYFLIILLFLIIGIISFVKIKQNYNYKQTYEYKFLSNNYTLDEFNLIDKYFDDSEKNTLLEDNKNDTLINLLKDNNFKKENLDRYLDYIKKHRNVSPSDAVKNINLDLDYDLYENPKKADTSKDILMLVNKHNNLDDDYVPDNLITISNKYTWGDGKKVRSDVFDAYLNMWNAALNDDIYLIINLGYRSFKDQDSLYNKYANLKNRKYADSITTRAGFSEHQTGLAMDILSKKDSKYDTFKESDAYKWLHENSYKYGFIERYTEENIKITGFDDEPWHYRYVGIDAAKIIYEKNITFEEYYLEYVK